MAFNFGGLVVNLEKSMVLCELAIDHSECDWSEPINLQGIHDPYKNYEKPLLISFGRF